MQIFERYNDDKNFTIQKIDSINLRICNDGFIDANYLFKQYNDGYYNSDTYDKKKNNHTVCKWDSNHEKSKNMHKTTIANFDLLYAHNEINIYELNCFMSENQDILEDNEIIFKNITNKTKINYMIRAIGEQRNKKLFVHECVAIEIAMGLSPNYKAIIISIFRNFIRGNKDDECVGPDLQSLKKNNNSWHNVKENIVCVMKTVFNNSITGMNNSITGMNNSVIENNNIIKESIINRDKLELEKILSKQCPYCMYIDYNLTHICPEKPLATMNINICPHKLLKLIDALSNDTEFDDSNKCLHTMKVLNRELDNIKVKTSGKTYDFTKYKHRIELFKKINATYYIDSKLLLSKSSRKFLLKNKDLLSIIYDSKPDNIEYAYSDKINA